MNHLESGNCRAGWTLQHINSVISEHFGSVAFVIKEREPFFRAGAPPKFLFEPEPDPPGRNWMCVLCRKSFAKRQALKQHFAVVGCSTLYPDVVQCPVCAESFKKFSALLQHVEMHHRHAITIGPIADSLQYLKECLADPSTKEHLSRIEYKMTFDRSRPDKLDLAILLK